ncbi:MAG: Uma2 family endonuclease [Pseudomonadota bacterium]
MSQHVTIGRTAEPLEPGLPTTRAAEGLPRYRWTRAKLEAAVEAGIFHDDDRFELIGGEIVPMSPKVIRHERVKAALVRHWIQRSPDDVVFVPETTLWLSETDFSEPDFIAFKTSVSLQALRPNTALFGVEVAASSLSYDLGANANRYARAGLTELIVIDADRLRTTVLTQPSDDGYQSKREIDGTTDLKPGGIAKLRVVLNALTLP